jgi:hypothetical protein
MDKKQENFKVLFDTFIVPMMKNQRESYLAGMEIQKAIDKKEAKGEPV